MNPFKKNEDKPNNMGSMLNETYQPATLPVHGQDLTGFIVSNYSALSREFLMNAYASIVEQLGKLIQLADRFTLGKTLDPWVQGQILHLKRFHKEEVASHEYQIGRIEQKKSVRMEELEREIPKAQEKAETLREKIRPLEGIRGHFNFMIGKRLLPVGLIMTVLFMLMDFIMNYAFLQEVLYMNKFMLVVVDIVICIMSDASMCYLGKRLSETSKDEAKTPHEKFSMMVCVALFLLSVVAGVMIRFGSMPKTFGGINLAGNIITREGGYTLDEYGVTVITAFATAGTGVLSLVFSTDRKGYQASIRKAYELELQKTEVSLSSMLNEKKDLEEAPDLRKRDEALRKTAEANIEVLEMALKEHVRKLLAEKIATADYMAYMSESAEDLLKGFASQLPDDYVLDGGSNVRNRVPERHDYGLIVDQPGNTRAPYSNEDVGEWSGGFVSDSPDGFSIVGDGSRRRAEMEHPFTRM